jgi:hypothetical protein
VSVWTVSRELGHSSEELVRRINGHLGTIRHRSEVVEYRIEQHLEALKVRLGNVGFVTRTVTSDEGWGRKRRPPSAPVPPGNTFRNGPVTPRMRSSFPRWEHGAAYSGFRTGEP